MFSLKENDYQYEVHWDDMCKTHPCHISRCFMMQAVKESECLS